MTDILLVKHFFLRQIRLINIIDEVVCCYNKDSIQKAGKEWIYPYIYKDDSLKVYDIQRKADHSPSFRMCLRTKEALSFLKFDDIDLYASQEYLGISKNLNYEHNTNTLLYRVFINFSCLVKKHFKFRY